MMGSHAPSSLPSATAPSLVLTHPTPAERLRIWSQTHPMWGTAMPHDDYLRREEYLTTVPLAKDGGITHWILTDGSLPPDARPILSSCESLRKRAVACGPAPAARVRDGYAHGIASVFTEPQLRGKGYARRMLRELGEALRTWQADATTESLFSVLYSDIGKEFYAAVGWAVMPSGHVAFPPVQSPATSEAALGGGGHGGARAIGYHELAELCAVDERLLRAELPRRPAALLEKQGAGGSPASHCAAIVPDLDQMLWHLMREDFVTKQIFGKTPDIRGAVWGGPGRRVWAVWMRGYYGGRDKIEGNTLHVLRVVVEDEQGTSAADLARAVRAIVEVAQAEAFAWRSADVQIWNPDEKLRGAIEQSGVKHDMVVRDKDSIASLMWYGEGPSDTVDWVINEKYAWC